MQKVDTPQSEERLDLVDSESQCCAGSIVVLNELAAGGRAGKRWAMIAHTVEAALPTPVSIVRGEITSPDLAELLVRLGATRCKPALVVAAGGDGTVHHVVNAMANLDDDLRDAMIFGAIGLGSSNDAHKPVGGRIGRIPVLLDWQSASPHDLCHLEVELPDGSSLRRWWLLNGSSGVQALANHRFNAGEGMIGVLKRLHTDSAIAWTAISTILRWRGQQLKITLDDAPASTAELRTIASIAVMKCRHVAGSFRFPKLVDADDGQLAVAVIGEVGRWRLLGDLVTLMRDRFCMTDRHQHRELHVARRVQLEPSEPAPFEMDGEVIVAIRAVYTASGVTMRLAGPGTATTIPAAGVSRP